MPEEGTAAGPGGRPAGAGRGSPAGPGLELASAEQAVLRRTRDGWRVGGADLPDLTCAMVLADLLAAELPAPGAAPMITQARPAAPRTAPQGQAAGGAEDTQVTGTSETSRLRATIRQLEHALTARVRVEQAIGVLAERHRIQPRQAFEQLRTAARNRGRKVIDIAAEVVASATNPLLQLPEELSRPHQGTRGLRPSGRS